MVRVLKPAQELSIAQVISTTQVTSTDLDLSKIQVISKAQVAVVEEVNLMIVNLLTSQAEDNSVPGA